MAWGNDTYIRKLLDGREKWGTVLSVTAVAGLFLFLADHPHRSWLNLSPLAVGALGTLYVLVVNCYYEQAEAIANARSKPNKDSEVERIRSAGCITFACRIWLLGWMNIVAPVVIGSFATLALYFGLLPTPITHCN